jgi:hypothetical protein
LAPRKRLGLGIAPFCIPAGKAGSDTVTHSEMQAELQHLRAAIILMASRISNELGTNDARRIMELAAPPHERTGRV